MTQYTPLDSNFDMPSSSSPRTRSYRPVLLDAIRVLERFIKEYHRNLLRAPASSEGDDIRSLAEFVDWSSYALARGRALLLQEEGTDGAEYRHCPPHDGPVPTYAARLLARRDAHTESTAAANWRRRLH